MSEFEYCYWLMGVFELGQPKEFNAKQVELIKEHLNLVQYREHNFCNWLQGVLDINESNHLSEKKTKLILDKLRNEFLTVIDKSYPREIWNALSAAHEGRSIPQQPKPPESDSPRFVAMC